MQSRPLRTEAFGTKQLAQGRPFGSPKAANVSERKRSILIADSAADVFNAISGQLGADGFTMRSMPSTERT